MSENKVIEQPIICRLHWIIFLRPLLILLIPILMNHLGVYQRHIFLTFAAISVIWFVSEIIHYVFTFMTIQSRNVILQSGFLIQQTIDIPLAKIESIDIRQSLIGTILNYGDLLITGSGGSRQTMYCIQNPLTCRRYIEQFMHAAHE
jgi:uncharacterized membrane protein YdbT with pleckstrin-like domain